MASMDVVVVIDWPNWASSYLASVKRRIDRGEAVDVEGVSKLIRSFANYRISNHG